MMTRTKCTFSLALALVFGATQVSQGFSLMGPFNPLYQLDGFGGRPQGLGYSLAGDIGGPQVINAGYRWNVKTIHYAFDHSFITFFGTNGIAAIEQAIAILNALPSASQMTCELKEFPLHTRRVNFRAQRLGLFDIKSHALSFMMEEMGLANPGRFVWGLRARDVVQQTTFYSVVKLNYDPCTLFPSSFVNGSLYSYQIIDPIGPAGAEWASAVEFVRLDPINPPYNSVAGGLGSPDLQYITLFNGVLASIVTGTLPGEFFTGLTRDDVGGLRHLLRPDNRNVENTVSNTLGRVGSGSPWTPLPGTNALTTTNFIQQGLRGGVDRITFVRVNFDSLLGQIFVPITNNYTDTVISNGVPVNQQLSRVVLVPDIVFQAGDLGLVDEVPVISARTSTAGWFNNDAINGTSAVNGPGVIPPGIAITFSDQLPFYLNQSPGFADEASATGPIIWGSFDASTNTPVIYPSPLGAPTIQDIERAVLGLGGL
jgi:hypothetical protein